MFQIKSSKTKGGALVRRVWQNIKFEKTEVTTLKEKPLNTIIAPELLLH